MNAVPLKNRREPGEIIDELIADYGFLKILAALGARILKRSRPPDALKENRLAREPRIDLLNDHLRRDLGLPPEGGSRTYVDLSLWARRDLF